MHASFRGLTLATLVMALVLIVGVPTAVGVHDDDLFQLDYVTAPTAQGVANVSSTNISPLGNNGDDWDKVYNETSSGFASAFIPDPVGDAETSFYTGGGSKDDRPINSGQQHWEWNNANDVIPDKDDISHAFAAAYSPASGPDATIVERRRASTLWPATAGGVRVVIWNARSTRAAASTWTTPPGRT